MKLISYFSTYFRSVKTLRQFHLNQHFRTDKTDSLASSSHPSESRNEQIIYPAHDEVTKLQQENFRRLLSNAESLASMHNDYLSDYAVDDSSQISNHSDMQRNVLTQRKQVLLRAILSIDKQIAELDMHSDN